MIKRNSLLQSFLTWIFYKVEYIVTTNDTLNKFKIPYHFKFKPRMIPMHIALIILFIPLIIWIGIRSVPEFYKTLLSEVNDSTFLMYIETSEIPKFQAYRYF